MSLEPCTALRFVHPTLVLAIFRLSARAVCQRRANLDPIGSDCYEWFMLKTYSGACHCGAVRFEVDLDIDHLRSGNCSLCAKRGALSVRAAPEQFRPLTPIDDLSLYQWHTKTAKDYFCKVCGILPYRRPRTNPEVWTINARCLENIDLDAIPVRKLDCKQLP
jgi:hypothetical protein